MLITQARCSRCNAHQPLGPGWKFLKPPPYALVCKNCDALLKTSLNHRANWLWWSLWYVLGILLSIALTLLVLTQGYRGSGAVIIIILGSLLLGAGGGAILALFLYLPAQIAIDLLHWILLRLRIIRKRDLSEALPLKEPLSNAHIN